MEECVALGQVTTECVPQVFIASQETTHYEIPFVKEYAMGFPFLYSVKNATDCIALQETSYSG